MSTLAKQTGTTRRPEQGLFAERCRVIGTENAFKVGPYIVQVERSGHRVIKCNLGEPDFPLPAHIREEVKRQLDADNTHYCDPQGVLPLRESIAREMGERRGFEISPDRVCVFAGAKPPIGFTQQTYCNPGDEVIYPSPGFPIYESFIRYVGAVPVPLHLEEEAGFSFTGADLEALITERTKVIILNFPSNPTGGVATEEQLQGIAEVIRSRAPEHVRVYSDEVYENILFDGAEHHSIASLPGMEERTILVSGASKSFSWTGGRIGWAVLPTAVEAALFKNLNINYISCVSPYNQMGAKFGLESPESEPQMRRMMLSFQERRDLVVEGLNAIPGVSCHNPRGAFYVFPNVGGLCRDLGVLDAFEALPEEVRAETSPSTLFQMFLLFRYHVAAMDRRSFGAIGSEGRHFLRLSIATGIDDLREAVDRIATAARDRDGFAAFMKEAQPPWN
ncbi:MAG: pyridoxal phosphate-dependent aminotransferase [Planctomycetota bacterium]|jgi:aspartate/methionine/tyrosine aminotransferase